MNLGVIKRNHTEKPYGETVSRERINRERFELIVKTRDVSPLKETVWKHWEVEDCEALLQHMNLIRERELSRIIPEFSSSSFEDQIRELNEYVQNWIDEYLPVDEPLQKLRKLSALLSQIEQIDPEDPIMVNFSERYKAWTPEQIEKMEEQVSKQVDFLSEKLEQSKLNAASDWD